MIRPLEKGDKVAIISLSSGILGESFIKYEVDKGIERLKEFGLVPVFLDNSMKGLEYVKDHPEKRVEDLKNAFLDDSIKGIICAIGGNDTYRTIPYIMEDLELCRMIKESNKVFLGYSDSTVNHLTLNKLGLSTFYGMSFLVDLCELDNDMLPYSKKNFNLLFNNDSFYLEPSDIWYEERKDFSINALNTSRITHRESHRYEVLYGSGIVSGTLIGGCIEAMYSLKYLDGKEINDKYFIFPNEDRLRDKIFFFETSDMKIEPTELRKMLLELKKDHVFDNLNGIMIGKPQDEKYYEEYKEVYKEVFYDMNLPVVYNFNFGHAHPHNIIPYDRLCVMDLDNKIFKIER